MHSRQIWDHPRNLSWFLFLFSQSIIVIIILALLLDVDQSKSFLLGLWGLGSMALAILLVMWSSHPPLASLGMWYVILLAVQHGGGWVLERIFNDQHYSRYIFYTDLTLTRAIAIAGTGILSFAVGYVYYNAAQRKHGQNVQCISANPNILAISKISWFILILWGIGILLFRLIGNDINIIQNNSGLAYISRSLFMFLAMPVIILISLKIIVSITNTRRPFTALAMLLLLWGGYVLLTGERQDIIPISLSVFVLASKWKLSSIRMKDWLFLFIFIVGISLGIVYLRAVYGRDIVHTIVQEPNQAPLRIDKNNINQINTSLRYDLGYRLNAGNILLGLIAESPTYQWLWPEPVTYSLQKLIPGFIWTAKANLEIGELPRLIAFHHKLPDVDYISTYITTFYAIGRIPGLVLIGVIFGIAVAFLDVRLTQSTSIIGLALAIGVSEGLLTIDHSIDALFIQLRNIIFLYLVLKGSLFLAHGINRR